MSTLGNDKRQEKKAMEDQNCVTCGEPVAPLEVFPAPAGETGVRCLACYAASPEGRRMPTADEVRQMWGIS